MCLYTSLTYKTLKVHLNKEYNFKSNTTKNFNIIDNIPLISIEGFKTSQKYLFISKFNIKEKNRDINLFKSNTNSKENTSSISNYTKQYNSIVKTNLSTISKPFNTNREEDFFNKTTRYFKYLEGKDLEFLIDTIDLSKFLENNLLKFLYNTTFNLGLESFNIIENLSFNTRKSINNYYINDSNVEVKAFKELELSTRRNYLKPISSFIVYLYIIYKKPNYYYNRPIIDSNLATILKEVDVIVKTSNIDTTNSTNSLKPKVLKVLDIVLNLKDTIDLEENVSFRNPIITYFIIASLDSNRIKTLKNKNTIVFKNTSIIQNLLSRLIYTTRLYTLIYSNYLTKRNLLKDSTNFIEDRLSSKSNNYFTDFYSLRIKLKYYNYNKVSNYKPIDDISSNIIAINNIEVNIDILRFLFNRILNKLEDTFYKDIIFFTNSINKEDSIIKLDLNQIIDSKDNTLALEDITKSSYLSNIKNTIIRRFKDKNTTIYNVFNNSKRSLEANIKLYLDKVYNFLELLALNIYLLSSSPLRGKAIVLLKFRNTSLSSLRNIFLDKANNLISIDTTNINKNDPNNTNLNTSNIRFLPIRLTKVLIYYITFIIPLIEYLRMKYLDVETIETRLFFKLYNKEISSFTLSKSLKTITKRYFKNPIGIKEYRHLITYIIKERIVKDNKELLSPRSKKTKDFNKDYTNIEDILANHSTKLANTNYTRETNYFSNKTRDITNRSLNFGKLYFNYFNLIEDRSIESILNTNLESSIASTNSSSLYTNKSKRSNNNNNKRKNIKSISNIEEKTISTIDSSSLNLSNNSKDENLTTTNIIKKISIDSFSSYNTNTYKTKTNINKDKGDKKKFSNLTNFNLESLEESTTSPSKRTLINTYINTINTSKKKNTSNINSTILEDNYSLDLENLFNVEDNNNNTNNNNREVISPSYKEKYSSFYSTKRSTYTTVVEFPT